jgi:hypothetical protein
MIYSTARRKSDGLLTWPAAGPNIQGAAALDNAVLALGGTAADWELVELTEAQHSNILAGTGRAFLVAGALTIATPPAAALSAATVENDGVAEITLTVTIPSYAGPVKVEIYPPTGEKISSTLTAVAGVASETISTEQEGAHRVMVETEAAGVAWVEFSGV